MKTILPIILGSAIVSLAPLCFAQREFASSAGTGFTIPLARLPAEDQVAVKAWQENKNLNTRPKRELVLSLEDGKTQTIEVPEGDYLSG